MPPTSRRPAHRARDAGQRMGVNVVDVSPAARPAVMHDLHAGMMDHRPAPADARAEVDVLAAEGVVLVPAADSPGTRSRRISRAAPISTSDRAHVVAAVARTVAAVGGAEQAGPAQQAGAVQQGGHGRPAAAGDLHAPARVAQPGAEQADLRMRPGVLHQAAEGAGRNDGVVVEEEKVAAAGQAGGLVVGAGEAGVVGVADQDDARETARAPCRRRRPSSRCPRRSLPAATAAIWT